MFVVGSLVRLQLHELIGWISPLHREALRDVAAFRLHEQQLLVRKVTVSNCVHTKISE